MSNNKTADIIIDNLSIRLPAGWQGDTVYLARTIAEQIQQQAGELQSTKQMTIKLNGCNNAMPAGRIAEQFTAQLLKQNNKGGRQ